MVYLQVLDSISSDSVQRKRMNTKLLFFSNTYLLNKIISAVFGRIC